MRTHQGWLYLAVVMAQADFVAALFAAAHAAPAGRIHTCLDTSGATYETAGAERFSALLDECDLVLLDIKASDPALHRRLCGLSATHALALGDELARRGVPVIVRHVVVPGLTDGEEEVAGVGRIIGDWDNVIGLDLLPYHTMGRVKYERLGIAYPLEGVPAMQRFLSPHAGPWDTTAPSEDFGPESDHLAWCRVPERKVTIEDVKYVLSLHYQGTPYDPYAQAGCPDRRGLYRPIGINRNSQLSVLQLRPYVGEAWQALQWVALGSNAFNALVPLYANVDGTPAYLENTTMRVTSENFYWANRLIGALADAAFGACLPHVERYQEAVGSTCTALVRSCDEAGGGREAANDAVADECRRQTDELLDKVLYETSMLRAPTAVAHKPATTPATRAHTRQNARGLL